MEALPKGSEDLLGEIGNDPVVTRNVARFPSIPLSIVKQPVIDKHKYSIRICLQAVEHSLIRQLTTNEHPWTT